jgi:carbamoyl-phosphate synthase large subunit
MRSTGEVLGMSNSFGMAFYKAEEATKQPLPLDGTVLITVADPDKSSIIEVAKRFLDLGFRVRTTKGTHDCLAANGVQTELINKMHEGRPDIVDAIKNEEITLVINTPIGKRSETEDSYIRKSAIKYRIPYITTASAALAAAKGIAARLEGKQEVKSLQDYHADIR